MKSRKKVSRKKTATATATARARASRKTSVRRNIRHTHRRRQRFTRIKRGGTIPATVIQRLRTFMVHNMRPLISQARPNIHFGHDPQAADGSITNVNDRFYQTFTDITFEDGDIKESIRNFIEEVKNPVKNADKLKSIYDAIMAKLKEEEEKQKQQQSRTRVVGKSFRPLSYQERLSLVDVGRGTAASGSDSSIAPFINPPFRSPNIQRNPDYSTNTNTPQKPLSKSKFRPQELEIIGTPLKIQFRDDVGPITSPNSLPPLSVRQKSNLLLSPARDVQQKINFDDESAEKGAKG